ncbi:MAG: hypothetical protein U0638_10550 [Phycisphaerales bacterium]
MKMLLTAIVACVLSGPIPLPQDTKPAQPPKDKPSQEHPSTNQPSKKPMPSGHPGLGNEKVDWPQARVEDVKSIDAIIAAFYKIPAGNPGEARDWGRYASLFTPDARMVPARSDDRGGAMAMYVPIGKYIEMNQKYFEKGGFLDTEVHREIDTFGHIAQVWSTYESRHSADDKEPYIRGINSIQLLKDHDRWWIVNVFWDFETPGNDIPAKYLPAGAPTAKPEANPEAKPEAAAPATEPKKE